MKAISLLLLRVSTGIYLVFWGAMKLVNTEIAMNLSQKYYDDLLSSHLLNLGIGVVQIVVGVFVMLGLFRHIFYKAQAVCYLAGLLLIIKYIADPFGLYLVESAKLTWFPSTTLFFAALIMLAFTEFDTLSIDTKRNK